MHLCGSVNVDIEIFPEDVLRMSSMWIEHLQQDPLITMVNMRRSYHSERLLIAMHGVSSCRGESGQMTSALTTREWTVGGKPPGSEDVSTSSPSQEETACSMDWKAFEESTKHWRKNLSTEDVPQELTRDRNGEIQYKQNPGNYEAVTIGKEREATKLWKCALEACQDTKGRRSNGEKQSSGKQKELMMPEAFKSWRSKCLPSPPKRERKPNTAGPKHYHKEDESQRSTGQQW